MAHDVFISYASKDINTVKAIVHYLEDKKIRCWYADRDITAGSNWAASIMDALGSSRLFILVFTDFSNESQQVLREVNTAVSKGIPIVPFKLTEKDPSGGMMYYLSTVHWLDAMNAELEKSIESLCQTAEAILNGTPVPKREPLPEEEPKKKSINPIIIAATAVIIVAILAFVWLKSRTSSEVNQNSAQNQTQSISQDTNSKYADTGYEKGETNIYDPLNLREFIKRDDNIGEDGLPIISLLDAKLELESDSGLSPDNYITYSYRVKSDIAFPDDIELWTVYITVNQAKKEVADGGYSTCASYEASINSIDYFNSYFGAKEYFSESPETYQPIDYLSYEQFTQLIKDKALEDSLGYRVNNDIGDSIVFANDTRNYLNAVFCYSHKDY